MKKQKQTQAAAVPEKSSDKLGTSPKKAETETAINSIDDVHPSNEAPKPRKFALDEKAKKIKDQGIKTLNPNETIGHHISFDYNYSNFLFYLTTNDDISKGKAKYPIKVINSIDKPPIFPSFDYRSEPIFSDVLQNELPLRQFCQCLDQCSAANGCLCINMSSIKLSKSGRVENVEKLNGNPFNFSLYECSDECGCAGKCKNNLGGNQQKFKLEIFRKSCAGYSCKTLKQIKKGSFICYMAGEVLSSNNNKISENFSFTFKDETRQFSFTIKMDKFANESRFFNSSCCPNLMPITVYRKWITPERPFIAFVAINEIDVGD
uniref:Pre-SET domain-containing protein n=1 Tax=Meloidogyne javanica TaxID=6303 RepID=A0A915LH72_MELJA